MADNIDRVRNSLSEKYEKVILGKHMDHLEYLKFVASMAGGPAGVSSYLGNLTASIVSETGLAIAEDTIYNLVKGNTQSTVVGEKAVYGGIATYNHWTVEKYPKIDKWEFSWGEIRVPQDQIPIKYI